MEPFSVDIRFYHTKNAVASERALTKLLNKVFASNRRAVVRFPNAEMCTYYDEFLWSHHPASFLPHGQCKDPDPQLQPILITHLIHNPNAADVLFIAGDFAENQTFDNFSTVCYVFGNNNTAQKQCARSEWKRLKEMLGNPVSSLTYHQQQDDLKWSEKMRLPD